MPTQVDDDGSVRCHECDRVYERIGYHWSVGSCSYPDIDAQKWALTRGLMLGDGTLRTHTSSPFITTYMINEPFLSWLDDTFGWLSTGVSLYRTAARGAELSRSQGNSSASASDYHDVYTLQTRTMPQFETYTSWYDTDGGADGTRQKRFPDDLVLDPRTTAIWYACDGSLSWDRRYPTSRPYATIGITNELDNTDNLLRMFRASSFEHEPVIDHHMLRFTVAQTEDLLDWMGDAPPGFEYKWCLDSLDTYTSLKDESLGDV